MASSQILSIWCKPMREERLQEITEGNSRGKQTQTNVTKKKKRKTHKM